MLRTQESPCAQSTFLVMALCELSTLSCTLCVSCSPYLAPVAQIFCSGSCLFNLGKLLKVKAEKNSNNSVVGVAPKIAARTADQSALYSSAEGLGLSDTMYLYKVSMI